METQGNGGLSKEWRSGSKTAEDGWQGEIPEQHSTRPWHVWRGTPVSLTRTYLEEVLPDGAPEVGQLADHALGPAAQQEVGRRAPAWGGWRGRTRKPTKKIAEHCRTTKTETE